MKDCFNIILFTVFLSLALLFSQQSLAQNACLPLFDDRPDNVQSNNFTIGRTLDQYLAFFDFTSGNRLHKALQSLKPGARWMDLGAGRAIALKKALRLFPQITEGIALTQVRDNSLTSIPDPTNFKELTGDSLEVMNKKGRLNPYKNKMDLLTCIFGPFSYMDNIQQAMSIYLSLLKPGGELHMVFQIARGEGQTLLEARENLKPYNGFLVDNNINSLDLSDWLRKISGAEVSVSFKDFQTENGFERIAAISIVKTGEQVIVPPLRLIHKIETVPPVRIFEDPENKLN